MDSHRTARTTMMPTNSIAVRNRLRHASPTISRQDQQEQQRRNTPGKEANIATSERGVPLRLARSSFQSRYQATRWSGPPSPTKGSSQTNNSGSSNNDGSQTNPPRSTNLTASAGTILRNRAASRGRAIDPPPTSQSPAKTSGTATTASSTIVANAHPNSISLTRRRLSQPIINTPPKNKMDRDRRPQKHTTRDQHSNKNSGNAQQQQGETELVCDYDTSATVLYELLEASKWDEARNRCRSHPAEVRTWIIRRDKSYNVRWKLLPLHAAIIFQSPNAVVSSLLEKYPHAASCPDDQGMLPLHLAFRHKQEDEDLLELLLVQYPKAVLLKDKRQRVPLEHGRESKFSAKLVWLYADATVIGSGGVQRTDANRDDEETSRTSVNTSLRADLEKELRREHKEELDQIRSRYEAKIQTMEQKIAYDTQHIKVVVDDERQTLLEQHAEEVNELKDLLNQQVEREANVVNELQVQVEELQNELQSSVRQNDGLTVKYGKMEEFNRELRNQLQTIIRDQLFIRDLATRQNNELDAARKMRAQIIQTLMQQEDTDGENDRSRSNKLIEMAENVRDRIHDILRNDPSEDCDNAEEGLDGFVSPGPSGGNGGGGGGGGGGGAGGGLGPSRIEMERGGHDHGGFIEDPKARGGFFEERDDVFLAKIPEVELRDADEALGDLKSLGDEISGITEHSPY